MVFLQGTVIMHKNAAGKSREEIVEQVKEQEESVRDFRSYIPVGNAPEELRKWTEQGAEICYLSALTEDKKARGDEVVGQEGLRAEKKVLDRYAFPEGEIYHRQPGETYQEVVERLNPLPDILIEDDCESIGGEKEMTCPNLKPGVREEIKCITVKEFGGIDHLPDDVEELRSY